VTSRSLFRAVKNQDKIRSSVLSDERLATQINVDCREFRFEMCTYLEVLPEKIGSHTS
jgi:hypothetical protein